MKILNWFKKNTVNLLKDIRDAWKFYLTFVIITSIYGFITKTDPEHSSMIIMFSFLTTVLIFIIVVVIGSIIENRKTD
jgi:quinol-cytochrome oxidoreductase complex cytochrome b subunit